MVIDHVRKILKQKSLAHQADLRRLGQDGETAPLTDNVIVLEESRQIRGLNSILLDPDTTREIFIFYFNRMAGLLIEKYVISVSHSVLADLDANCLKGY